MSKKHSRFRKIATGVGAFLIGLSAIPTNLGFIKVDAATYTLQATEGDSSYKPTQLVNGDFSEYTFQNYYYDGTLYTKDSATYPSGDIIVDSSVYNETGWNTSELKTHKGSLFEWISHNSSIYGAYDFAYARNGYPYNDSLSSSFSSGENIGCVEMNSNSSAVFYQDLKTCPKDIIRWSLDHAVRTENDTGKTPDEQQMYVEIGAPNMSSGKPVPASGTGKDKNSQIGSGKVTYEYDSSEYDLSALRLYRTNASDKVGWHTATGVYSVPKDQTLTRFAFIATGTSSYGNLLDNITFKTLVGNLHAVKNEKGELVVTGYWGDTDPTKKLKIDVGKNTLEIDMSAVSESNFRLVVPSEYIGSETSISVYHEDYPGSAVDVVIVHSHTWNYSASGATLSAYCSRTDGSDTCNYQGSTKAISLSISATNKTYDCAPYAGAAYGDTSAWFDSGQETPAFYYVGRGTTTYTESKTAPTNAGTYTVKIKGGSAEAKANFTISALAIDNNKLTINKVDDQTYTGSAIEPGLTVSYDGVSLVKGTDYTVSFTNNINVGTATASLTFINNYSGTASKTFKIVQKDMSNNVTVTLSGTSFKYTGSAITPTVKVESGTKTLTKDTDYTVSYSDNTNPGTATVTISFIGNYKGSTTRNFTITKPTQDDITVTLPQYSYGYTGSQIKPTPAVTYNGKALTLNTDYTVSYGTNIHQGTDAGSVKVTYKGNYTGEKTVKFSITAKTLDDDDLEISFPDGTEYDYTGSQIKPTVVIKDLNNESKVLTEGTDYTLTYTDNTNPGQGNVKIELIKDYSGTVNKKFTIKKGSSSNISVSTIANQTYTGKAIEPALTVKYNDSIALVKGTDYDVVFSDNIEVGTATASITFKGNYEGSKSATFKIVAKSVTKDDISISFPDDKTEFPYTGSPIDPGIIIKDKNKDDKVLKEGEDYELEYSDNTNPGECIVTIKFKKDYEGELETKFTIKKGSSSDITATSISDQTYTGKALEPTFTLTYKDSITLVNGTDFDAVYSDNVDVGKATITITFKGKYEGTKVLNFNIVAKQVTKDDISISFPDDKTEFPYTGSPIDPGIIIKDKNQNDKILEEGVDYDLEYSDNTNPGECIVTIKFKNDYEGELETKFTIKKGSSSDVTCSTIADQTYTGSAITPDFTLTYKDTITLINGTDFDAVFTDNIDVGQATITITFKGKYEGTKVVNFNIVAKSVTKDDISISFPDDKTEFPYTGSPIDPGIIIKDKNKDDKVLKEGEDYELEYSDNTNPGECIVTIKFKKDYEGELETKFTIKKGSAKDIVVDSIPDKTYTGKVIEPDLTVTYKDTLTLVKGTDYDVIFTNNIDVGTATANLTFKGKYEGSKSINFTIASKTVIKSDIDISFPDGDEYKYTGSGITPNIVVKDKNQDDKVLKEGEDYELKYSDNVNPGECIVTIKFKKDYEGELETKFTIKKGSSSDITCSTIVDQTYTGKALEPTFTLTYNDSITLIDGTDFDAVYSDNIDVGQAKITATFKGKYEGTKVFNFNIVAKSAGKDDLDISFPNGKEFEYTGTNIIPSIVIKDKNKDNQLLEEGTDYILHYSDNVNPGTCTVTIEFIKDYKGLLADSFVITQADASKVNAELNEDSFVYTGKEIKPDALVTFNGTTLVDGKDYYINYKNNIEAGKATATIVLQGKFKGEIELEFTITRSSVKQSDISISFPDGHIYQYTGDKIYPNIVIKDKNQNNIKLVEGVDYKIIYEEQVNAGTWKITFEFLANYEGTLEDSFTISKGTAGLIGSSINGVNQTYTGKEIKPGATLTYKGKTLTENVDYKIEYENNIEVGKAKAIITLIGNFEGTINKEFNIIPKSASKSDIDISFPDGNEFVYTGDYIKPNVIVKDKNNNDKLLVENVDYTLTYKNNKTPGTGNVVIKFIKDYKSTITENFTILKVNISQVNVSLDETSFAYTGDYIKAPATLTYNGMTLKLDEDYTIVYDNNRSAGQASAHIVLKGYYEGETTLYFDITQKDGSKFGKISLLNGDSFVYTGQEIKPEIIVSDGTRTLDDDEFDVEYINNINVGTATIHVTFKTNYSGEKSSTFEITKPLVSSIKGSLDITEFIYSGNENKPTPTLTYKDNTLKKDVEYEVSYKNNINVGQGITTITLKGNFEGEIELKFVIKAEDISDKVETNREHGEKYQYTSEEIKPDIVITIDGKPLKEGVDYEVTYVNNVEVGNANLHVKFKGNYTGTLDRSFVILAKTNVAHIIMVDMIFLFIIFACIKVFVMKTRKIDAVYCIGTGLTLAVTIVAICIQSTPLGWATLVFNVVVLGCSALVFGLKELKIFKTKK